MILKKGTPTYRFLLLLFQTSKRTLKPIRDCNQQKEQKKSQKEKLGNLSTTIQQEKEILLSKYT
jgi:hypothetical protein